MKRVFAIVLSVLALALGATVPAHAGGTSTAPATANITAAGPCGSSYTLIGHYAIGSSGTTLGYLDVYWSSTARRNCAVTNHSSKTYGVSLYTQAMIRPTGYAWPSCPSSVGCDGAFYRYYAGPVYTPTGVDMSRRCLDAQGIVDWATRSISRAHCA